MIILGLFWIAASPHFLTSKSNILLEPVRHKTEHRDSTPSWPCVRTLLRGGRHHVYGERCAPSHFSKAYDALFKQLPCSLLVKEAGVSLWTKGSFFRLNIFIKTNLATPNALDRSRVALTWISQSCLRCVSEERAGPSHSTWIKHQGKVTRTQSLSDEIIPVSLS